MSQQRQQHSAVDLEEGRPVSDVAIRKPSEKAHDLRAKLQLWREKRQREERRSAKKLLSLSRPGKENHNSLFVGGSGTTAVVRHSRIHILKSWTFEVYSILYTI